MGLRGWVKKKAKKAKDGIEHAGRETQKAAEQAAKETKRAAEKAAKETERLAREAEKEAKRLADLQRFFEKEARKVVEKLFNDAKRDGERFFENLAKDAKDAFARDLPRMAESAFDDAKEGAQKAFVDELPGLITDKLPALLEEGLKQLASDAARDASKIALETMIDTVELLAPTRYTLVLGVELALVVQFEVTVSLTFPNPLAKLTEARAWAKNPPKGREQIMACVRDFGPESLSVEAKVSGNGGVAEWDGDDKYDRLEAFLKKQGV